MDRIVDGIRGRLLVRPTVQAPVLLAEGEARLMRWGFERPWAKSINNTRTDKLETAMWREAFETRRCVIPMSGFYEYTGPAGRKQAHLFQPEDPEEWLWAAGIWEPDARHGDCYSMLMRDAAGIVVPIHNRMPVLLNQVEHSRYLTGGADDLQFAPVPFIVADAPNPLRRKPETPEQSEFLLG